jgi:hypothetical protein
MREVKKSNEGLPPPVASVALVITTVGVFANKCSRRIGPTSIGAADSVIRSRFRLNPRSI